MFFYFYLKQIMTENASKRQTFKNFMLWTNFFYMAVERALVVGFSQPVGFVRAQ